MLRFTAFTAFAALFAPTFALAADIEARSRIDAVVVYPDAASISRVIEADLPQGASTLIVRGLPFALDPASLRVSGEASVPLVLGAVETRNASVEPRLGDSGFEARLKSLRSDREGWQVTIGALEAKQAMILRYSQASPEKLSPDAKPLDIAQWNNAFDLAGTALAKVGDELRSARTRAREIDDDIKALETGKVRPPARGPLRDVTIALEASAATKAKIMLGYQIGGASWRAAYDARLDTGAAGRKPSVELVRRATIVQRTGEDWADVALSISTVRAARGTAAPDLIPERLAFWEPPVIAAGLARPRTMQMEAGGATDAMKRSDTAAPVAAAPPPVEAVQQQAALEADAYQANFRVAGVVSVPGDGTQKSFSLSSRKVEPTLMVRSAPVLDPAAFLEARMINNEDAPLLPGVVAIQRDGTFVGPGRIALVAPGESFDLGFGVDDKVRVTRVPVKRKENEPTWFGQTKTEVREFKTSIRNLHDFAVKMVVQDRVPFSENTAIVVELQSTTTVPTEKQVGDKRGVLGWTFDLAPQGEKEIKLAYRLKWPADRDVVMQPAPLPGR